MIEIYFDDNLVDDEYYAGISNSFKILDDKFSLGSTSSSTFKIEVPVEALESIPSNVIIKMDGTDYAHLIVDSYSIKDKDIVEFQLTDKMILFNYQYDMSSLIPCTVKEIIQNICLMKGVVFGTTSFINDDVLADFYDNSYTAREYISFIAELNAGFASIGSDGKLYFKRFNSTPIDINIEECDDFKLGEHHKIERVVFDNGLLKFETSQDDTLETLYLNSENPFITTEEIFNKIANEIIGFEFYSVETNDCLVTDAIAGDLINFIDGDNSYLSIAQYDRDYNGQWIGGYSLNINSKQQNETQQIGLDSEVKNLKVRLNRDEVELDITAENVSKNSGDIANLNIRTDKIDLSVQEIENDVENNYSELIQTVDSLMVAIQNTGGSNLIKNSVMFSFINGSPENWIAEGDGTISAQSSSESLNAGGISGQIFILNGKTVRQRVYVKEDSNDIPKDQKTYYTFSCKIKKAAVGTGYIKIFNDKEEHLINLASGQDIFYGDYEVKALLPKSNYYDIELYGSVDSNLTFTDVMFALGEYKTSWMQASGEIMNSQVNINVNGILVKSLVYEGDYTVMSPLEFAGYSMINGVITKVFSLNKDTTDVKKLKVDDEIKMVPIKVVPIKSGSVTGWALVKVGDNS